MDYKEIIKNVEKKRNDLYKEYKRSFLFKKTYIKYLSKYDELLLDLYKKYEKYLTK